MPIVAPPSPSPPGDTPPPPTPSRGIRLPDRRSSRAWLILGIIAATAALVAVPFALLDEDDGTEQASSQSSAESDTTETSPTQDSDSDGIPDVDDEEPFVAPGDVAPEAEEPEDAGPEQKVKSVGQSANDDGVKFTLHSLEEVQSVPVTEYSDPIAPRQGAKLIAARVSIKNNGQSPIDPLCGGASGMVLLDERDRNYNAEDNVLEIQGNDSVCGDGIAPGFADTFTVVFEMPKDAAIGGLVVWNSDSDDDSSGEIDQILFTP